MCIVSVEENEAFASQSQEYHQKRRISMIIIGNGRMVTRDPAQPFFENGAVVLEGTKIVNVGTLDDMKAAYHDAEFIDAKGGVIMPAFINAHEHIYSSFARGLIINGYNPQGFLEDVYKRQATICSGSVLPSALPPKAITIRFFLSISSPPNWVLFLKIKRTKSRLRSVKCRRLRQCSETLFR